MEKIDSIDFSQKPKERGTISNAADGIASLINRGAYPEEALESLITTYKRKRELIRTTTEFSPEWQEKIAGDLEDMMKFRETQVVDQNDPQDDGVWNSARLENMLRSWKQSCEQGQPKLLEIDERHAQQTWNEIVEGYLKKKLIKK